jgi:TonB family protein
MRSLLPLAALFLCLPNPASAQPRIERTGSFVLSRETDPITDADRSTVFLKGTRISYAEETMHIAWLCREEQGMTVGITSAGWHFSDPGPGTLLVRFDSRPADSIRAVFVNSTSGAGGGAIVQPESWAVLTEGARGATRMVVRVEQGSTPLDYRFDLTGSNRVLGALGCAAQVRILAPRVIAANERARAQEASVSGPPGVGRTSDAGGVYDVSSVDVKPSLSNSSEISAALQRNYPPLLRDAGVGGTVILGFRVDEDGRVNASTIEIESTDNEQFSEAAKKVVERMRFRPAKVNDRPVKVRLSLPVTFTAPQ